MALRRVSRCRALRYACFAPEAPSTAKFTALPFPDSVRTLPPPGWAKILEILPFSVETLSFPEFIWRTGLTGEEVFHLLLISIALAVYVAVRRGWLGKGLPATPPLTQFMSYLSGLGTLGLIIFFCYNSLHTRYQLRPGVGRYIPGAVYAQGSSKRGKLYWYTYSVAGNTYQHHALCAAGKDYPPRGTRYYIQYSLAEPALSQSTGVRVPDTLRTVPSLGWGTLPTQAQP